LNTMPYLVISDADTSRTILSTFIGGLLSLVVFSFSMVMLLLSQASANYSPRLLPGLISEKKHQIVLGTYLGTIIYDVIILINILPNADTYQLPGFAILLGIIFGIFCMAMFVYFIHSISQEIQISNILITVFIKAKKRILFQNEKEEKHKRYNFPDLQNSYVIKSKTSGYFQGVNNQNILDIAIKYDTKLEIIPIKGMFILSDIPAIYSEKELEEEVIEDLLSCLHFNQNERVEDNYILGFKQITEIAVKAMSPGINDPGTAISAIDYLSELFSLRMLLNDEEYLTNEAGDMVVNFNIIRFKDLIYNTLAPLRQYAKHDILVMQKLILMLKYLYQQPMEKENYKTAIEKNMQLIVEDLNEAITNENDLERLLKMAKNDN